MTDEILRIINGSHLYGTNIETSDVDIFSIFVEKPKDIFLGRKVDSRKITDRPEGQATSPGEEDGIALSLRHYLDLVLKGNPSQILTLFVPEDKILINNCSALLLSNKHAFISRKAGPKFKGYLQSQKLRLIGEKKGHVPSRPELVERYGYDPKYAAHMIRLALQGIELMNDGKVTLPMKKDEREFIIAIREGFLTLEQFLHVLEVYEEGLCEAVDRSILPAEPNYELAGKISQQIHETMWRCE